MKFRYFVLLCLAVFSVQVYAGEFITSEPDNNSYQYVSTYQIEIDAPADRVWTHLVNLGSWMYDFEMSHYSGPPGMTGEVFRLYPNQDFFVQVTGMDKDRLLTISNLPVTFNGEYSTGVAVISLSPSTSKTIVNLTMSRRYTWQDEGENPMKQTRVSPEFQTQTSATWNRFLQKLQSLADGT